MTFVLEGRSVLFGLLTATALASITAITERLIKRLLPRPRDIDRRRKHIDGRDALSELIVSCEGFTSLIAGPFVHRLAEGRCQRPPLGRRVRIILLFILSFIVTMLFETITILASGSDTKVLKAPDITPFSFVERHIVVGGANLPAIRNITLNKQRCVENKHEEFNDSMYFNYWQGACLRTKVRNYNISLQNWTLFTEENQVDAFKLFLGRVIRVNESAIATKKWEKVTYAQVAIFIERRIVHNNSIVKRILDADSARVVYNAVHQALPPSRCDVTESLDNPLDRDQLGGRPAMLANFTCNPPITVPQAVSAMETGSIASVGLYYYDAKPEPKFVLSDDASIIKKERDFDAGMSVTESYEDQWFIALFAVTAVGILCFGLDRMYSRNIYPNVALISIMNDISRSASAEAPLFNMGSPDESTPVLVAHVAAKSPVSTISNPESRPTIRYSFVQREDAEHLSLEHLPRLAREHKGLPFT